MFNVILTPSNIKKIANGVERVKVFSFFAGSGFLDLGFESSGIPISYVNEIYTPFLEAYKYSRKYLKLPLPEYGYYEGNIIDLLEGEAALKLGSLVQDARHNSNIVGFIGGPPCPDFSVGGKNRGSEGDRGHLSASYIELICQQKPDFFLFENVKGLYRTKKHRSFFEKIKNTVNQAGYILVERIINSIEYGVPQDRDRIILIGFSKKLLEQLGMRVNNIDKYIPDGVFPWKKKVLYSQKDAFFRPWPHINAFQPDSSLSCPNNILRELTVEYWFRKNDVFNHANAKHYFTPRAGISKFRSIDEGDDSRKSSKRLHRWRYSPTACYGNNEVHLHPYKVRRISAAEALSIQSMPKDFCLPESMSLTAMFKTIGNGVPYLASKAIAQTILEFLNTKEFPDCISETRQLELPLNFL